MTYTSLPHSDMWEANLSYSYSGKTHIHVIRNSMTSVPQNRVSWLKHMHTEKSFEPLDCSKILFLNIHIWVKETAVPLIIIAGN